VAKTRAGSGRAILLERFVALMVTPPARSERDTPECRLAIQMLIDAAEDRGPVLFAKVGIERAFYRNAERIPYPKPRALVGGR
jgi:hypothetical protein